ncbi:DUF2167 domain-containing protein [Chryseolinea lacunae]|uniref:DUF2167 domain-containing protein n=1 Tax=Chryseolinea lacunae TaxID=2801331 RepID=A0ABS1KUN9_9BACT|nr:DUF2167 domain-containing protein [Chryseolinea lacunae]MBL0743089.1 DUF2167 domain-containing protein [Chryseolinea lacunae]
MKPLLTFLLCVSMTMAHAFTIPVDSAQMFVDSLEATFNYQHGEIKFENEIGTLNVPAGFRYLDAKQTEYVIHDLWGNPGGSGTLGMILPDEIPITDGRSWAFIISYEEMGHVKDDDADDIDYDEMLGQLQEETVEENKEREKEGYEPITIVGWAAKPYYDADKKVLHWAKEIKFGTAEANTLNYNVRILGRKGVLVLNAVASMDELPDVEKNISPVLSSFSYSDGNKYSDFNPDLDEVAAWTIGGLVAGKVLAKVGILALLLKNIKLIGLAIVGAFAAARKWLKRKVEPPTVRDIGGTDAPPPVV